MTTYSISGTFQDQQKRSIGGLTVRLVRVQSGRKIIVSASIKTNSKGQFRLSFQHRSTAMTGRSKLSAFSNIQVQVFDPKGKLLKELSPKVKTPTARQATVNATLNYSIAPPPAPKDLLVSGQITLDNQQLPRQFTVEVVDQDLRQEQVLGIATVDHKGHFRLEYSTAAILRAERGSADLFIRVYDAKGQKVAQSSTLFNAPERAVINLEVAASKSYTAASYEAIEQALPPILNELSVTELEQNETHKDLDFIAAETGFSIPVLRAYVLGHHLEEKSKLSAEFWFALLLEGDLLSSNAASLAQQLQGVEQQLPSIEAQDLPALLQQALAKKLLPASSADGLDQWIESYTQYLLQLEQQQLHSFTQHTIQHLGIRKAQKRNKLSQLLLQQPKFTPSLLQNLQKDPDFQPKEIEQLQSLYQLRSITKGNFELVGSIQKIHGIQSPQQIRQLAKLDANAWVKNLEGIDFLWDGDNQGLPSSTLKQMKLLQGQLLQQQFAQAYPTMSFAGALERELNSDQVLSLQHAAVLQQVIEEDSQFDLLHTPLDSYSNNHSLLQKNAAALLEIKAVQRVFKLAPDFKRVNTLLKNNLHSAQQIYRIGRSNFVQTYQHKNGFDLEQAQQTWDRAEATHAATTSLIAELQQLNLASALSFLPLDADFSDFPNWENLFQGGNSCACQHCQSVYSPSAYFADLMLFLQDRQGKEQSLKNLLLARRPDLGYLELSCANANTLLPYVDVVNEVLEAAVAGDAADVELSGITSIGNSPEDRNQLETVCEQLGTPLEATYELTQIGTTDNWVLHSSSITYLLVKKGASYFARILPNTKQSSELLRARPQYVNPVAYEQLQAAVYPATLPFDLNKEKLEASFDKLKQKRWKLLETFQNEARTDNPTVEEITAVYLGIGVNQDLPMDEWRIITQADTSQQNSYWGSASNAALLLEVKNVKNFLQHTHLTYTELLILLDVPFTNPEQSITIEHPDTGSCDLEDKVLEGLSLADLDRWHRFLRLWRKLKLELWEVDLLLRHPAIGQGNLNEEALIQIRYLLELREQLGGTYSIGETLSLLGDIPSRTIFVELHKKRQPALYQALFLNPKLVKEPHPAFELTAVQANNPAALIEDHVLAILAALRLNRADLEAFVNLRQPSTNNLYIPLGLQGQLSLSHLSFLYSQKLWSSSLKQSPADWSTFLQVYQKEVVFATAQAALDFLEQARRFFESKITAPLAAYALQADNSSTVAPSEANLAKILNRWRKNLKEIRANYAPEQYDFLQATPLVDTPALEALVRSLLEKANRSEAEITQIFALLNNTAPSTTPEQLLPLKFVQPFFVVPLDSLPESVEFSDLPEELAAKISYDAPALSLELTGFLSPEEVALLLQLHNNPNDNSYQDAINSLANQALTGSFEPWQVWLEAADLDFAAANFYPQHLALAAQRLLLYWIQKDSRIFLETELGNLFGWPATLAGRLLQNYELGPINGSLMPYLLYLLGDFTDSNSILNTTNTPWAFRGLYWLDRVYQLGTAMELSTRLWYWMERHGGVAQSLDWYQLPIINSSPSTPLEALLTTLHFLELAPYFRASIVRDSWVILGNLNDNNYNDTAPLIEDLATAAGVALIEVESFVQLQNLNLPTAFLTSTTWQDLQEALGFSQALGSTIGTLLPLTVASPAPAVTAQLEQLLQAKYGESTWLTLQTELEDHLRGQKREALVAYLLAQEPPADAPSGKWQNSNDLYAYYLLDVQMGACMQTSRLVQGAGSIQLFVQRCFLGLEPEVMVDASSNHGDSAWNWWKWMRKYRVWEANRKVFLYPENWTAPELRPERSDLFRQMERQLLQAEMTDEHVQTAFTAYLEQLTAIAHLEVAAYYQEDRAQETILHIIGRTESIPHVYYYRTYDYRVWTPWEKIEAGITGNHLIPFVVNQQLHLYWPEFMVVGDNKGNKEVDAPKEKEDGKMSIAQTAQKTQLHLCFSRYQNGTWTAKQTAEDVLESAVYVGELDLSKVHFHAIDLSSGEGTLGIRCKGAAVPSANRDPNQANGYYDDRKTFDGFFDLAGPRGLPSLRGTDYVFEHRKRPLPGNRKYQHYRKNLSPAASRRLILNERHTTFYPNGSSLAPISSSAANTASLTLLSRSPLNWKLYMGHHLSYFDTILGNGTTFGDYEADEYPLVPVGAWLPFAIGNEEEKYFVFPLDMDATEEGAVPHYYPALKQQAQKEVSNLRQLYQFIINAQKDAEELTAAERLNFVNFWSRPLGIARKTSVSLQEYKQFIKKDYLRVVAGHVARSTAYPTQSIRYHFVNNYHPFAHDFLQLLYHPTEGIEALMRRETQLKTGEEDANFITNYGPTFRVLADFPRKEVDFSPSSSYSNYNWELFYHAPLLIANSLSNNQRFEEAMKWYHYIFNPLGLEGTLPDGSPAGAPNRFWITKPFFVKGTQQYQQERIDSILNMLAGNTSVEGYSSSLQAELEAQVRDWRQHPFEPHRIAQYRTVAYQKNVFMKYLDNLIAWGDQLFRQDSMESINEAIQLYVLAAELLGSKPQAVPPTVQPSVASFNELEDKLDAFANALIQVENYIPPSLLPTAPSGTNSAPIPTLYFCIPENDKLLGYWDVVADRLYKIRNCMNIDGIKRSLSLFEPAIDPRALVHAVGSAGGDFGAALADLNAPLPFYRFGNLLQQAHQVCEDVVLLGEALLLALEKKDAEELALLCHEQETKVRELQESIADLEVKELEQLLEAWKKKKEFLKFKKKYYDDKVKARYSVWEILAGVTKGIGVTLYSVGTGLYSAAAVSAAFGSVSTGVAGVGGSPLATIEVGGATIATSVDKVAKAIKLSGTATMKGAEMIDKIGKLERKVEKWKYNKKEAEKELPIVEAHIKAAEQALAQAKEKAALQTTRLEQAQAMGDFMTQKYTQQELYQWMVGELSTLYFERYQLAYDLAKKAERSYGFELGIAHSSIIQFGHWNSLKKGLLSGEKLQYQLRKLEQSYTEKNRRELELTKHFSLALLDPFALHSLREEGSCLFDLEEAWFDLDYPGHYFRRIKSVSLSLPCEAGTYTTIACTLSLTENYIRTTTEGEEYAYQEGGDARFVSTNLPLQSIATSHAQKDNGLFELDFQDERYLPFEGAGAVSKWQLTLFTDDREEGNSGKKLRQFDYQSISDAVLHLHYTAREGGGLLKNKAIAAAEAHFESEQPSNKGLLLHLKETFAAAWAAFQQGSLGNQSLVLPLSTALFPYIDQQQTLKVNQIQVFVKGKQFTAASQLQLILPVAEPAEDQLLSLALDKNWWWHNKNTSNLSLSMASPEAPDNWEVRPPAGMDAQEIEDILLLIEYQWL